MKVVLSFWEWLKAYVSIVIEVFLQRWWNMGLPADAGELCHADVVGKTCIVTGPTSGIGQETARELARAGAHVVLACRNTAAGWRLVQQWQREQGDGPPIKAEVMALDLASLESVRAFGESWQARHTPLHVLINNAGIFSMSGPKRVTEDGYEEHLAVNYLAPALLTMMLLPALMRTAPGRVVFVSSAVHTMGEMDLGNLNFAGKRKYSSSAAYFQSKLCQLMFTNALQRRLPARVSVDAVAVHPGEVMTNVVRTLPKVLQKTYFTVMPSFLLSAAEGARSVLYCATNPDVATHARFVRELGSLDGPYYSSNCKPANVARHARDLEASDALWTATMHMVGLPDDTIDRALGGMSVVAEVVHAHAFEGPELTKDEHSLSSSEHGSKRAFLKWPSRKSFRSASRGSFDAEVTDINPPD